MPSLSDFTSDWNKYKLDVNTDRGTLTVKWNDANNLALWSNIQAALYLKKTNSLQTFYENFPQWYQYFWDARFKQGLFDVADDSVILDIGCGIAVIDLLLAQYLPQSKFYLLDKEGFSFRSGVYYDPEYPEYNSWDPVRDAIDATELDSSRFTMLSPDDTWPEEVDVISSYLSYCWHYPKETYWNKVLDTLKVGGKLILDVRLLKDRDVVNEISEDIKSYPTVFWFDSKLPEHIDNMPAIDKGKPLGGRFLWTRKK